jgi:hypothetical protein
MVLVMPIAATREADAELLAIDIHVNLRDTAKS